MEQVDTFIATIYCGLRAGYSDKITDLDLIRDWCKSYCNSVGFCVSFTPTEFIYKDGSEPGVIIGIINYPRFPKDKKDLKSIALYIATKVATISEQKRISILFPDTTITLEI